MPQPNSVERLTEELLALYRRSWNRITADEQALINSWTGWRRIERLRRLQELRTTVEQLMDRADQQALKFTNDALPEVYLLGAAAAGVGVSPWTQPDVDAIGVLAQDTYSGLLDATTFVRESTKDLIRTMSREHIADKLIVGQTAEQAARELAGALEGRGIAAVIYKDGSRHGLSDYSSVVVRTKSAEAYSTATLNSLDRAGIGFAECFDNPRCGMDGHDDPNKPNGHIFEIRVAQSAVISHPRCVRSWGGRPDVTSTQDAKAAKSTATAEQHIDQANVAISREEAAIARALRRRGGIFTDAGSKVTSPAHGAVLARRQAMLARRRSARSAR